GSLTLLKGEHPSVQMVREKIAMVLEPKSYETTVDFVFKNAGPATKVLMGFPESGSGDVKQMSKSQMLAFSTWVDGTKTTARWVPVKSNDEDQYEAHWVKEVSFAANQVRKIRVRYRSEYGGAATGGLKDFVSYNFTGANWKGKVEESELTLTLQRPGSFVVAATIEPLGGESGAVALVQKGATLSRTWRNWEAQADFTMAFGTAPASWRVIFKPGMDEDEVKVNGAVILPATKLRTLTTPGTPATLKVYDWCPPALDQSGEVLVAVGQLENLLGGTWEISPEEPTTSATLKHLGHTFNFTTGKSTAIIDGKSVTLPIAPRTIRGDVPVTDWLYVPFSVIAKALGQKYEALKDSRTLRIIQ
ncbi:stalk domain-containing protein, partial [Armatimonas sp.]|uniref:stalk domain-containing protein n=1 Tax=Armatimonas sp. TaxID=1872638 RepID=UPI00286CF709